MAAYGAYKIESLKRDNYETWKIQMKALLVKNDTWTFVAGLEPKPEVTHDDEKSKEAFDKWKNLDEKAKSDIILCISPAELKQVKYCETSHDVWKKLEEIYQSKGPARKASLLKALIQHKMTESNNIREHLRKFFDIVDKLSELDIKIDDDLLTVMLLYSLPASFENFRCAIESRDELPKPDVLRIKIIEESDARRHESKHISESDALIANFSRHKPPGNGAEYKKQNFVYSKSKIKCFKCKRYGHRASECTVYRKEQSTPKKYEIVGLLTETSDALSASEDKVKQMWCLDSGCTRHLCNDRRKFVTLDESDIKAVNLANNEQSDVLGSGQALIKAEVNRKVQNVDVHNTLFVPELKTNLLSVSKLCDRGYTVIFTNKCAIIRNSKSRTELIADRINNLYYLRGNIDSKDSARHVSESIDSSKNKFADHYKWHCRMGHLNIKDLVESCHKNKVRGLNITKLSDEFNCDICALNKLTRAPFPKRSERATKLLEIVHSDLCGPIRIPSLGKSLYFMTFIDDFSRYCTVKFLKTKDEALESFKEIKCLWEKQKGVKIKKFMSDNGGEFINNEFKNFLKKNGIEHRLSLPFCQEQNGVSERKNRTLVEMARCLLSQSKLPLNLWAEAVNTANYIRNRCPSKSLNGKTPYEMWNGVPPNISYFKIFGCTAYALNNRRKHKFAPRSKKGIFVGYSENSKAFKIYFPDENKFILSRSVKFFENCESKPPFTADNLLDHVTDDLSERGENSVEIELLRNESAAHEGGRNSLSERRNENEIPRDSSEEKLEENILRLRSRDIVRSVCEIEPEFAYGCNDEILITEALKSNEASQWYEALITEMKNILKNDTFEVVDRPKSQKCIDGRFVLTNKYDQDGSLLKHKARFVARGFTQKPGIDFRETFAPVARIGSIRIMAALSAKLGLKIHQFDVTSAYLNGKLNEKIFMECPEYFVKTLELIIANEKSDSEYYKKASKIIKSLNAGDKVLLLKKSLYGLKQAGRCWNDKLNEILIDFGAKQTNADPCLYYIRNDKGLTVIMVYVDDILFMSEDTNMLEKFKNFLKKKLEIKYVGIVKYCLGINFQVGDGIVAMSQQSYIKELLNRFGMLEAKPVSCPMDVNIRLQKAEKCHEGEFPYRELVGGLMYLATSTRPDIANAVSKLSQFLNCFDNSHWSAAKHVLRYLKKTINFGLIFKNNKNPLFGYCDADWGNCPDDRKSYTGYCFIFCGSAITWESRKQCTVALSSTEAEYMALSDSTKEAIYLSKILSELCDDKFDKIKILTDNRGSIKLAENPVFHKRTKHIDIRHHFVREALKNEYIDVDFVSTEEMGADVLTKPLPSAKHYKCLKLLGIEKILKLFG